jgi:alkanesulfonate monooxygenase SsuD/methylene tetrahydromethanopterin reductase-like flavin-dependent oxidoreductase (luciferase family)
LKPKFGVRLFNFVPNGGKKKARPDWDVYAETAIKAQQLGYDKISMCDHLFWSRRILKWADVLGAYDHHMFPPTQLELWTTLSSIAALVPKIRIVSHVNSVNFRPPSLVAKISSSLDVISGGRLEVGIGTGGDVNEAMAYGYPDPGAPAQKADRLVEFIKVLEMMWTKRSSTFKGSYYSVDKAMCEPKPVQKPHPPLNIAGRHPATVAVAARYADVYTPLIHCGTKEQLKPLIALLDAFAGETEKAGRSYDKIEKTGVFKLLLARDKRDLEGKFKAWLPPGVARSDYMKWNLCATPEEVVERYGEYLDAGINTFLIDFLDAPTMDGLQLFASDVMKKL